uniref:Ig-like domain-containing protein n=1 Tax=Leptobrachium leishanense TaxID=445787 RepID=A0A8C5R405_9ANUR
WQKKPSLKRFLCQKQPMYIKLSESVTLECTIAGYPSPSVVWYREDYRIENSIDFQITYVEEIVRLVIREAFAEDSGRFTCTASNEAGTVSTSCYLLVQGKCKKVNSSWYNYFILKIANNESKTFDTLHEIKENNKLYSGLLGISLHISFSSRSVSPRSPSRSPGRSPARSPARRLDETDESQLERLYKPVFVLKPTSVKIAEGQTARFDLKVVGRPMPETFWFHNGKLFYIVNDYTHKIVVKEDGTQSLIIVPAMPTDSGEWTVIAQNRAGKTSISTTLTVEAKEYLKRPQFVEKLKNVSVKEGSKLEMSVKALGNPNPDIVWLKNNAMKGKIHDAAWYTATAINKAGRDTTRCKVNWKSILGINIACTLTGRPTFSLCSKLTCLTPLTTVVRCEMMRQ